MQYRSIKAESFSVNSYIRAELNMKPTASECQFMALGLKYAIHKLNYLPIKKRYDSTLKGNKSNHYDNRLKEFAVSLIEYRRNCRESRFYRETIIQDLFLSHFGF